MILLGTPKLTVLASHALRPHHRRSRIKTESVYGDLESGGRNRLLSGNNTGVNASVIDPDVCFLFDVLITLKDVKRYSDGSVVSIGDIRSSLLLANDDEVLQFLFTGDVLGKLNYFSDGFRDVLIESFGVIRC